jgi:hypothetical protein
MARPLIAAIDQRGDEHVEAILRQAAGELIFGRESGHEAAELFRRLTGVA